MTVSGRGQLCPKEKHTKNPSKYLHTDDFWVNYPFINLPVWFCHIYLLTCFALHPGAALPLPLCSPPRRKWCHFFRKCPTLISQVLNLTERWDCLTHLHMQVWGRSCVSLSLHNKLKSVCCCVLVDTFVWRLPLPSKLQTAGHKYKLYFSLKDQ